MAYPPRNIFMLSKYFHKLFPPNQRNFIQKDKGEKKKMRKKKRFVLQGKLGNCAKWNRRRILKDFKEKLYPDVYSFKWGWLYITKKDMYKEWTSIEEMYTILFQYLCWKFWHSQSWQEYVRHSNLSHTSCQKANYHTQIIIPLWRRHRLKFYPYRCFALLEIRQCETIFKIMEQLT